MASTSWLTVWTSCKLTGMGILREEKDEAVQLYSYSGELLDDFVTYGTEMGYSGMEALSAIPGTVGAAPVQNVGAYGQDISQSLVGIRYDDKWQTDYETEQVEDGQSRGFLLLVTH